MSDINTSVWDRLRADGFEDKEQPPGHAPRIPTGITEIPDAPLMDTYLEFQEWGAYAGTCLAAVGSDLLVANKKFRIAAASAAFLAKDAKTVAAQKAAAAADPKVQAAEDQVIDLEAYKLHLHAKYEEFEKGAQYCSRELSRRLARHERENRGAKWGV